MYPFVGRRALRVALCAVLLTAVVSIAGCNDYSDPFSAVGMQLASAQVVRPAPVGPRTYVLRPNDLVRVQVAHVDIDRRELDLRIVKHLGHAGGKRPAAAKKSTRGGRGKNTRDESKDTQRKRRK